MLAREIHGQRDVMDYDQCVPLTPFSEVHKELTLQQIFLGEAEMRFSDGPMANQETEQFKLPRLVSNGVCPKRWEDRLTRTGQ